MYNMWKIANAKELTSAVPVAENPCIIIIFSLIVNNIL